MRADAMLELADLDGCHRSGLQNCGLAEPISTFGVDVDTASYTNIRRFLNYGQLPPASAVRVEEMINYFAFDYPPPKGRDSFSVTMERGRCPWNTDHELLLVGLQGRDLDPDKTPPRNLVFLVDVSGSMSSADTWTYPWLM